MIRRVFIVALLTALTGTLWGANVMFYHTTGGATVAGVSNEVSWAGGVAPLVGVDISILEGLRTQPTLGAPIACPMCVLNFATGAHTGTVGAQDSFLGGGSFTISGHALYGLLVTGFFTTPATLTTTPGVGARVAAGVIINSQPSVGDGATPGTGWNTDVFLPGPVPGATPWVGTLSLDFVGPGLAGAAFTSTAITADLDAFRNQFIPEPASYALFGAVASVLGLGLWRRRRTQA